MEDTTLPGQPVPVQSTPPTTTPGPIKTEAPLQTRKQEQGRPETTDEQFKLWLDELTPFLKMASSLNYCIDKAGLEKHRTTLYEKYQRKDWFYGQIKRIQATPGETANQASVILINKITDKIKQEQPLSDKEYDYFKWWNSYHRTGQKFFVTRTEQVAKDDKDAGQILDSEEVAAIDDLFKKQSKDGKPTNTTAPTGQPTGANPTVNK